LRDASRERVVTVAAATAAAARDQAEDLSDAEIIDVRLLRVLSFSCRVRDGRTP
jgi:hypothetical protein